MKPLNTTFVNVFFGGKDPIQELESILPKSYTMTTQEVNIKTLQDQGFTYVEATPLGYWFDSDDYTYYVTEPGVDAKDTLAMATLYSPCCGEEVDEDYMVCPKCYEHV